MMMGKKRCGVRTQKRREAAKIKALSHLIELMNEEQERLVAERNSYYRAYQSLQNDVVEWDRRISQVLGTYSFARFNVPKMDVKAGDVVEIEITEGLRSFLEAPNPTPNMTSATRIRLEKLSAVVEELPDDMRMLVMLKLNEEGRNILALSKELLIRRGLREADVKFFAIEIARQLVTKFNVTRGEVVGEKHG